MCRADYMENASFPDSIQYFGETLERKKNCEVDEKRNLQRLTASEKKLGYELKWMWLEEALCQMRKVETGLEDWLWKIPWLRRDSCVMEILLNGTNQPRKP